MVLTDGTQPSPFLAEIERVQQVGRVDWEQLQPAASITGARLEIRAYGGYSVKDELKALRYRWNAAGKYWVRTVLADDFSAARVQEQPWFRVCDRIEIVSELGDVIVVLRP